MYIKFSCNVYFASIAYAHFNVERIREIGGRGMKESHLHSLFGNTYGLGRMLAQLGLILAVWKLHKGDDLPRNVGPTSDGVSRHASRLETVSRHGFSYLELGLVSTLACLVLARVSSFHVPSCLVSHGCVLTLSLSGIAMCLFCDETLTFLAERRSIYLLLTYLM